MKILLDECVPWPIHKLSPGHECAPVQRRSWGGKRNGELLRLAEAEFDLFITSDQSLQYQQNLTGRRLAILALWTTSWPKLQRHLPEIIAAIEKLNSSDFVELNFS